MFRNVSRLEYCSRSYRFEEIVTGGNSINNSVNNIVEGGLCCGCGLCAAICPKSAVEMILSEKEGVYFPEIDPKSCNSCGRCIASCPGQDVDFMQLNINIFGKDAEDRILGNFAKCYAGHAKNHTIRYNASSGGLITQLLMYLLKEGIITGALVTKMSEGNPLEPQPFIARTDSDILEASKSKYCPVPLNIGLREIKRTRDGERIAVVGLPCHIHGIRKAEQQDKILRDRIVLHIGIFCLYTINFNGTNDLLNRLGVKGEDVVSISYRGEGWPGSLSLEVKSGKRITMSKTDYYNSRFNSFIPKRCILCFDHTCEFADISFGDAWLPEFSNDSIGKSIVVARTEQSVELLQSMKSQDLIDLVEVTANDVKKSQKFCHFKKDKISARMLLLKLSGKRTPRYNQTFKKPSLGELLNAAFTFSWLFVASKRHLRPLLNIKVLGSKCARLLRNKGENHD